MKINDIQLVKTILDTEDMPKDKLPQIALAGRSNVGKSSFINTIAGRRVAKISATPGKTGTINFYKINGSLYLVDMPGYGYAKASKEERDRWSRAIEGYLSESCNLKGVLLLVDIRHRPTKDDVVMHEWILSKGLSSFVIATKADKLTRAELNKNLKMIAETLNIEDMSDIIPFSSLNGLGKNRVLERVFKF
ncbi:ribosome biogenesis GTP-binding protein YihA/YsxC [Calorimonas adulescens]|jgi:ribosome biogenesis GTP-binding protein YsxC/EngB|uniref:Probable GTP-binding protein EngB n=1 Tax=Calorimonas adulescens TaxID=2606906 RepID=A0A5D8QC89_9THEO|nr:ribosome biogenesis GTP-binding protein YihA/YsxC [Calorimonas adulescens]TZE81719.1 YihA family ribosome biogenesis GTP-binding protein [Calorimonas adulescens]